MSDTVRSRDASAFCGRTAGPELTQLRTELLLTFGQPDERPFRPHVSATGN